PGLDPAQRRSLADIEFRGGGLEQLHVAFGQLEVRAPERIDLRRGRPGYRGQQNGDHKGLAHKAPY
ncbi:MAG: hypothetical protein OEM59_21515, partial [Rhodospirillales bacterium]|nr:hypothetical protein [Rhodospirillales bacterium]